ncbi:glycerol kinase GlpK [Coleofasciculus sp. FACHB-SPT36]|uniref:glycerol kinase GlpK n=1 Tax=Cyanophyceae TaxID=3028117 RepID=UPI00168AF815|nr:glycerol kinase GlpK [Coleofasciculus sp. FACHB-SPT36]MBD2539602.1 glycerol kinase GlpK [Coleofasciculus sp. FACHB-SPT36]
MTASTPAYVLALDLGTTGNRAILFNADGMIVSSAYKELTQYYPQPGWLEHDPREIWQDTCWAMQTVLQKADITAKDIAAIGLSVQRETCLLWDKTTGRPLHNAIVWQDRRTAPLCNQLASQGHAADIYDRTGLVLDAYFSATKLAWLLEDIQREYSPIDLENVFAGTIDTWILWNLTGGKVHATDDSNASRTMLMNLASREWDQTLLKLFKIPVHLMPKIQPSLGLFGYTQPELLGSEVPIMAILGDQQASLFAHGCDRPGLLKCTYGTGCFLVTHTGEKIQRSRNQLLSTVAWTQTGNDGQIQVGYGMEGSIFTTGACIQWLRDGIKLITAATDTERMAQQVADNGGVYFVPALSGLGAPHWDMSARGAFFGITGGVQREHMVRAVLEAIAFQVKEVVQAINQDSGTDISLLKVDGGACQNDFLMQFQADVLGIPVERPAVLDASAQGAAFAAGLAVNFWQDYTTLTASRQIDRTFQPGAGVTQAQANFSMWQKAVERAKHWAEE